jgi:two-component system, sensor histidine kinase
MSEPKGILIVEDENIVALDIKMRLESLGYRIVGVVDTGAAALESLNSIVPDLILMDIKLRGEVDGIETARIARERVEVPIIFVTAFTDESTLERAKVASPYGYIVKPFHERELRIAIELALYKFKYELSMRRSKDLAEEANRMKGEFLANISHELKTPLNSVIGFTELALDRVSDSEQGEYLVTVLRSSRSLVTLIDSILDFAKLENGRMSSTPAPFSLDGLLGECVDLLAIGAQSKGLDLSFRRDPRIPDALVGDRSRLKQVLMNLADNAVKFTDKGRIRLCVSNASAQAGIRQQLDQARRAFGKGGILVSFVMEDTGIGMPPEKINTAFERFTQLDGSKTRPAGGTGLGLAIVQKSVELLSGSITVKSEPGVGSRFEVLVPLNVERVSLDVEGKRLAGKRVAIVGFPDEGRRDAEELLSYLGAAPASASSLAEALSSNLDFVIADERAVLRDPGSAEALRGRLVAVLRLGYAARDDILAEGCATLAYPVRMSSLLEALSVLDGKDQGGERMLPARREPFRSKRVDELAADDRPALTEGESEELKHLVRLLAADVDLLDWSAAERDAKNGKSRFSELKSESCERLAFSALLLSRKGDGEGLRRILNSARAMLEPEARQRS